MKTNSLMLGAAVLMLATACSNDEVVKVAENSAAIGFNSFVNNSTRYGSTERPETIEVYAVSERKADETGGVTAVSAFKLFNGGDEGTVKYDGSTWSYSPVKYWVAGNDYTFAAIAPAKAADVDQDYTMSNGGIKTLTFTNNDGDTDLLYAAYEDAKKVDVSRGAVEFNFGHILSRVRVEFLNGLSAGNAINVSNLTIKSVNGNGDYEVTPGVWNNVTGSKDFSFAMATAQAAADNSAVSGPKYIIPTAVDTKYQISFDVEILIKDAGTNDYVAQGIVYKHTATLPAKTFEKGTSYAFKTTLNKDNINPADELHPIEFTAEVEDWNNEVNADFTPDSKK